MQVPLDFPSGACVVVMSSIIGTRISICPKKKDTWQVVPNLWGGLIQKPSQLKSPPVKEVLRPMKELETEAFKKFDEDNLRYEKEFRVFEMRKRVCEEKMKYALKKEDAPTAQRMAHTIKANFRTFGVSDAHDLSFECEKAGKTGDLKYVAEHLAEIQEASKVVSSQLREFIDTGQFPG